MTRSDDIESLERRLAALDTERETIARRVRELRERASGFLTPSPALPANRPKESAFRVSPAVFRDATITKASPESERIAFFLDLFHARRDVYAERFEGRRSGKSGYQPVCANLWKRPLCQKPRVRCRECPHRVLVPLTEEAVRRHLAGEITIGIYPMLPADTCGLLAVDFDKDGWEQDAAAFRQICASRGLPAALERSRSGKGGHVWLFFEETVSARTARHMGAALITETMSSRPSMGLDSYDRLFPNQDNMPKGGFGSLVALPLQRGPAKNGNSLFVDESFGVYTDQWAFLSSMGRIPAAAVQRLAQEARDGGRIIGVRPVALDDGQEDPWSLPPSRRRRVAHAPEHPVPGSIRVVLSDEIYIPKSELPPPLLNEVVRLAAFQNPEFYRAQAMRRPVYGKPRVVGCAADTGRHIGLPRGCLGDVESLMAAWGVELQIEDRRCPGRTIGTRFIGTLRDAQAAAARALLEHDCGVLAASTAFGKTVVAIYALAQRAVNTLVLVHRRQLMDQWVERLDMFLDVDRKDIGCIGGSKRKPTGLVDVAVMQSLCRKGDVDDLVADYGHLIVDECHHVSARTFELIARRSKARYVLGLSATVTRKDGHHPIVFMQCGPVRFRASDKEEAALRPFTHTVEVVRTGYRPPQESPTEEPGIQEVFRGIVADDARNTLIAEKALSALRQGRSPVLLTERRKHLEWFHDYLSAKAECVVTLHGGMGVRHRRAAWAALKETAESGAGRLVLATGRYLGEGFDDARLDTLLLAMPVSWKGTVAQYAGRLHRLFADKKAVTIYDFVDESVPVLVRMFERRKKGYTAIGYSISGEGLPVDTQQIEFDRPLSGRRDR